MQIDFGQVAEAYAAARDDIPAELFSHLRARGIVVEGANAADIGAGFGVFTRALAFKNAAVVGVEPSVDLLRAAGKHALANVQFRRGWAEQTGLPAHAFDLVTVMRGWHWFDRAPAIREMKRILKEEGTLLVMDSGFTSENAYAQETFRVVRRHMVGGIITRSGSKKDARQHILGFPVEWFEEWRVAKLCLQDCFTFRYSVAFTIETWCQRIGSMSWLTGFAPEHRTSILEELQEALCASLVPHTGEFVVPHAFYVCVLRNNGASLE